MRIELHSSNRPNRPLGTGRSTMHGARLKGSWRRTAHGPKGTVQGNGGSATQGGIRTPFGSLPFSMNAQGVHAANGAAIDLAHAADLSAGTVPFPTLGGFDRGHPGVHGPG